MKSCLLLSLFMVKMVFASVQPLHPARVAIIPKPNQVIELEGVFVVNNQTKIISDPSFAPIAHLFSEQSGIVVASSKKQAVAKPILFEKADAKTTTDSLGYRLIITPDRITLLASSSSGAFYGMQSLMQLILLQPQKDNLPCCEITDHPRFSYRGVHLDVSRHFFPVSFVKRFIDLMALYKMNTFHWHLVDGPGWRLEIKKYPELTSKAAWRTHANWKDWWESGRRYSEEGNPNAYGGYYTQEQAHEIVAYAAQRGITVIPEIEMPGHSEEVLAVYPHLSCSGISCKNGEFCLGNDSTFIFMQDVLTEVMDIFPSKYIHIGGDEANKLAWKQCPKCQKRISYERLKDELELQSYGVRRMEKFLMAHGRKLLGWDEILEGGLAPEATVMSWRGEQGGIDAAEVGHDVVMTPGGYCYFDSYQADPNTQPPAIGGYLTVEKVYSYEPVPAQLNPEKAKHILGAQANLWTEYIPTTEHLEYMAFPRLLALSEVTWSDKNDREWNDFKSRLQSHYLLMQRLNINYCRPSFRLEIGSDFDYQNQKVKIHFNSEQFDPTIYYTLDGSVPTVGSKLYDGLFEINGSAKVCAAIFEVDQLMDKPATQEVDFHQAIGKKVIYNLPFSKGYPAQHENTLVNGYRGSLTYGDGQWQGFESVDMDVTIDLEKNIQLKSLSSNFMQLTGPGVFIPGYVEISLSEDGKDYRALKRIDSDVPASDSALTFKNFKFDLTGEKARYIRLVAKNDHRGFLFADEIIVY